MFVHSAHRHFLDCVIIYLTEIKPKWKIHVWRGGRGKAERAKGGAGSETSGESVGK